MAHTNLTSYALVAVITAVYSISEIIIGLYLRSLLLLSDGFHNLSDVGSLAIAYASEKASEKKKSTRMTFGWPRMKIVGALINNVALFTLGVYIALDSIPKFLFPELLKDPIIIISVGAVGVLLNTVGSLIFGMLGVGHGHDHSHGDGGGDDHNHDHDHGHDHNHSDHSNSSEQGQKPVDLGNAKASPDSSIFALFIHYLGDAISSFFVLIAGIIVFYFNAPWVVYVDPVASCFVVGIIIASSLRPIKLNALTLLQAVPRAIDLDKVTNDLLGIKGVLGIHDLHVWEMVNGLPIASVHVNMASGASDTEVTEVTDRIKDVLHSSGIHSTTVQIESKDAPVTDSSKTDNGCDNNCVRNCDETNCCKS